MSMPPYPVNFEAWAGMSVSAAQGALGQEALSELIKFLETLYSTNGHDPHLRSLESGVAASQIAAHWPTKSDHLYEIIEFLVEQGIIRQLPSGDYRLVRPKTDELSHLSSYLKSRLR